MSSLTGMLRRLTSFQNFDSVLTELVTIWNLKRHPVALRSLACCVLNRSYSPFKGFSLFLFVHRAWTLMEVSMMTDLMPPLCNLLYHMGISVCNHPGSKPSRAYVILVQYLHYSGDSNRCAELAPSEIYWPICPLPDQSHCSHSEHN